MKVVLKKCCSRVLWSLIACCYFFSYGAVAVTCSSGWVSLSGSYYNNKNASGTVAATRADTNINFNWVAAAPGIGGLGADAWSIRWDGTFRPLVTGNYKFQTITDDGVRLYIDGVQIINDWNGHAATTNTSANIALVAGQLYTLRMDYYDDAFDASAVLKWLEPGATEYALIPNAVASPDTGSTCSCTDALMGGFLGDYYNSNNLGGSVINTRIDKIIDYSYGTGAPGVTGIGSDNWSAHWTGTFRPSTTGTYYFQTTSDDGVRLWVNGVSQISSWIANNSVTYTSGAIAMTANTDYPLVLEYYEGTGSSVIRLQWKLSTGSYASMGSCPAPAVSYYGISHSGSGATCAGEPITISAYDVNGVLVAPPSGTMITLSTASGAGTWVGGATYTFNGSDTSTIKYLQQTSAATLNINVTDGSHSETASKDPTIAFTDSTLTFYGSSGLIAMPNQVSGTTDAAPVLKSSCSTRVTGTLTVGMAYECRNPTSCVSGQSFKLAAQGVTPNDNGATIAYSTGKSLTFDVAGVAPLSLNYNDVGQVRLHAKVVLAASGNDPAITLSGTSSEFVVKPHTLVATAITTSAGVANPGGSSVSGTGAQFVSAGTAFKVYVEARNAAGTKTPNFGNETVSENNITFVGQSLIYPAGGTLTALSGASTFTRTATPSTGEFLDSSVVWNQVGSLTARPELADNDYLGAGDLVSKTTSGTIGRFYPDHFALVAGSTATNSCGTFSYLSQPAIGLGYTLQAQGASNTVLTNYGGNYAIGAQATPAYVAENSNSGNGATFTSRLFDGATPTWSSGAMTVATTAAYVSRLLTTYAPDGPFTSLQWGLDLTDTFDGGRSLTGKDMNALTTGACGGGCTAVAIGSPLVARYGRLRLESAGGPETADLPVNFVTEYWTGSAYTLNSLDSCTVLPRSTITYTPVTPTPGGGGALSTDAFRTVPLAAGKTTTGIYQNLDMSGVHFTAGKAGHYFSAPTTGGVGTFTESVNLTSIPWLRHDWNQNGDFSDTLLPNVAFSFGTYRGNDRIIYWHERF